MGIGFVIDSTDLTYLSHPQELKSVYMDTVSLIPEDDMKELWSSAQKEEMVTLYHGTTSTYLNRILSEGIKPRGLSPVGNWEDNPSHERLVYLTNKWHYFYAEAAAASYLEILDGKENNDASTDVFPCYVECKVPGSVLMIDEDFLFSRYVTKKFAVAKRKQQDFILFGEECLAQYGTAGILGGIPPTAIHSFTILGALQRFSNPESQYVKEYHEWQQGKGKGKLRLLDLMRLEESTWDNATWFMNQFNGPPDIKKILRNPTTKKISIVATNTRDL